MAHTDPGPVTGPRTLRRAARVTLRGRLACAALAAVLAGFTVAGSPAFFGGGNASLAGAVAMAGLLGFFVRELLFIGLLAAAGMMLYSFLR